MVKVTRKKHAALVNFQKASKDLDGIQAKVGWFETARYEDGTPVAYVAAIQEHGHAAGGIPPRPTLGPTAEQGKEKYVQQMKDGAEAILDGRLSAENVMNQIAAGAVGDLQKNIATLTTPELAESTIKARMRRYATNAGGSPNKPLIDTGTMIQTTSHTVERK